MGILATISNSQTSFPIDIIARGGEFATISLIISLSIALLLSDSRHWNRWAGSTLYACSGPLILTFIGILAHQIMLIL